MNTWEMRRFSWLVVTVLVLLGQGQVGTQGVDAEAAENWVRLYEPHTDEDIPYRLMRPHGFEPGTLYPVIVSLHGGGGRGTDNRKQLRGWNRVLADGSTRAAYPSYVLAPQTTRLWDADDLLKIKAIVAALPSADTDRIYLLGHSMGGHGTYILLQLDPDYFAAAAPSAGTGRHQDAEFINASLIKDVPIWAFHGDIDTVCPYERAEELFAEMERLGGNMKLTTWEGDGHSVGTKLIRGGENGTTRCSSHRCDEKSGALEWLFSQSLVTRK